MTCYAVVNDNVVINVIVWNGITPYAAPEGCALIQSDTAAIGDLYDGAVFTKPAPPPEPPPEEPPPP